MRPGVQPNENLLHEHVWCDWSLELANMLHIWRTASSRSFDWCAARRRRLRAAGVSGAGRRAGRLLRAPLGRVAARVTSLHHSLLALHLNPTMALGSCSLSLLVQVHEAAAVVESGGEAGDEWRPTTAQRRAAADDGSGRDSIGGGSDSARESGRL